MIDQVYKDIKFMERFRFEEGLLGRVFAAEVRAMPAHMHEGVELMYLLKGQVQIRISFNQYALKAGDFLLVNPYEVHSLKTESPAEILFVQIDLSLFEGKEFAFDPYFYEHFNLETVKVVKALMVEAYHLSNEALRKTSLREIFDHISALCDSHFQMHQFDIVNKEAAAFSDSQIKSGRIRSIYEYMYDRFHQKMKLSDVAEMEHIDMFYTSRLIKDGMGDSFQKTLNIIRTDRAEVFLLGTDLPVQQVGEKVGFSSHAYFVKHFKALFGMAPSVYRQKYKEQIYPRKKMDYHTLFYDRVTLSYLVSILEECKRKKTEEQYLEDIEEALDYVQHLCSLISNDYKENSQLCFLRKDKIVKIVRKCKNESFIIERK